MPTIKEARERVAKAATRDGEHRFAREVLAGCWDHRRDVQACLLRPDTTKLKGVT
jgi:hypothetical protein